MTLFVIMNLEATIMLYQWTLNDGTMENYIAVKQTTPPPFYRYENNYNIVK